MARETSRAVRRRTGAEGAGLIGGAILLCVISLLPVASANPYAMTTSPTITNSNNAGSGCAATPSSSQYNSAWAGSPTASATSMSSYGDPSMFTQVFDCVGSVGEWQSVTGSASPFTFGGTTGTWNYTATGTTFVNASTYGAYVNCGTGDAASAYATVYLQLQIWNLTNSQNTLMLQEVNYVWNPGTLSCTSGQGASQYYVGIGGQPSLSGHAVSIGSTPTCTTGTYCKVHLGNGDKYNIFLTLVCSAGASVTSSSSGSADAQGVCSGTGSSWSNQRLYVTSATATRLGP